VIFWAKLSTSCFQRLYPKCVIIASLGFIELFTMCVLPFIAADIVKAVLAAGIANTILPKTSYGREVDS